LTPISVIRLEKHARVRQKLVSFVIDKKKNKN